MERYPHQLSGGLLQRAAIATALSCGPQLVVADEPTTALDAIVQVQVIESFRRLVRELGTSLIVITHALRLLERMTDPTAAMYAGRIPEFPPTERLLRAPQHPYTEALLASSVLAVEPGQRLPTIDGQPPLLPGTFAPCAFAPRCPRADERCFREVPTYPWPASEGFACHHPLEPHPVEAARAEAAA
jgi:oligopeptide/dipeptide ABC transporter ATP-binding protein